MRSALGSVLIVESDLKITEGLSALLKLSESSKNIKVLKSYSIREALVKVDRQRFSLIILGTVFPDEHFEDLLLAMDVGENLNYKSPVILISKKSTDEIFEGVQHKVTSILSLPFEPMELVRISTKILTTN